jgi:hypothetical protein
VTQEQQLENSALPKKEPEKKRGGKWVTFGEEQWQVPPLAFGAVVSLQDDVENLKELASGGRPTPAQMDIVTRIVHSAVARNYPSVSQADIAEMIDLGNYMEVLSAVLNISGFVKGPAKPGGAVAAEVGAPPTSP